MRHLIVILFLSWAYTHCIAQSPEELQKITRFKENYLKKPRPGYRDSLTLGHLLIIREKYPGYRKIKTIDSNKDFIAVEAFYDRSNRVKVVATYDTIGRPVGMAYNYTKDGALQYVQDHDKGEWFVFHKESHPYYELQNRIKLTADSLISTMYGSSFLTDHTVWIIDGSYISNDKEQRKRWTEALKEPPTTFSFCYKVKMPDDQNVYTSYIYFDLDRNGNFLPNIFGGGFMFSGSGFENVPDSAKGTFRLNYKDALKEARRSGLLETDSSKAFGMLYWEDFRKRSIYNGQFRFYILIQTKAMNNLNPGGRSSKTTRYDVYSFSPWTGNFIERKKMKTVHWWEKGRSGFTLLEPDKD